jgi:hypothetical protein
MVMGFLMVQKEKPRSVDRGFLCICINYSELGKTNPPTFEKYYLLYYVLVRWFSTDLGA